MSHARGAKGAFFVIIIALFTLSASFDDVWGQEPPPPPEDSGSRTPPLGDELTLEEWLDSGEAEDLNEDGLVDQADYELLLEYAYGGPEGPGPYVPPLEEWLDSDEAEDLNGDGFVDQEQSLIHI